MISWKRRELGSGLPKELKKQLEKDGRFEGLQCREVKGTGARIVAKFEDLGGGLGAGPRHLEKDQRSWWESTASPSLPSPPRVSPESLWQPWGSEGGGQSGQPLRQALGGGRREEADTRAPGACLPSLGKS